MGQKPGACSRAPELNVLGSWVLWRRRSGPWTLLQPARLPEDPRGMRAGGHVSVVCTRGGVGSAAGAAKGLGAQVEGW